MKRWTLKPTTTVKMIRGNKLSKLQFGPSFIIQVLVWTLCISSFHFEPTSWSELRLAIVVVFFLLFLAAAFVLLFLSSPGLVWTGLRVK